MFNTKYEKSYVSKSYANSIAHIGKLRKEIGNKYKIINHLIFLLKMFSLSLMGKH